VLAVFRRLGSIQFDPLAEPTHGNNRRCPVPESSMAFSKRIVNELLARTGRMCAVCNRLHGVQVHHIVPRSAGGSDEAANAIPLCPNCHDEVHAHNTPGRTTRLYSEEELRGHLERTTRLAATQAGLRPGSKQWKADADLVRFYAQCLDRPAFRTPFHQEMSFADLDQALEDTALAINTGYWRTRDGAVISRARGKTQIADPGWRQKLDESVGAIEEARRVLRRSLELDRDFRLRGPFSRGMFDEFGPMLRGDSRTGCRDRSASTGGN